MSCEELEPRLAPAVVSPVQTIVRPPGSFGNAFGWSVATSGTEVLIGGEGEAYLFNTSGQLLQTFQDPDPNGSNFGISVALSGSNVLIGADGEGQNNDTGAAYLFNTNGQLLHTFADPSGMTNTGFGFSVAMSGSSVVISAFEVAYLFDTSGNLLKTFFDGSTNGNDSLGLTVALSDSNVLVGVGNEDAAYLYSASGQLVATLSDGYTDYDYTFGAVVALSGNNVLVSAPYSNDYRGEVFLYDSSGHLLQTLENPDGQSGELFGISAALSGNYVLVGADSELADAAGGSGFPGAAFLYTTSGQLVQEFRDPDAGDTGDLFGDAVALGGSNVVVARPGAVYLYNTPAPPTATVVSVNPVNITYGSALANSQLSGTATETVNGQTVTVAGTFTYTSADGAMLNAGIGQSEAVTFTPSVSSDFITASATVVVNVAQATPLLNVKPVNITYGTALANSQLSGTATWIVAGQSVSVAGTFSFTTAAVLPPGSGQSEAVTFTPGDATDYATASTMVIVNVAQPKRTWMTVVGQQLTELYREFLPYYNARAVASFVPSNDLEALNVANGEVAIAVLAFVDTSSEIIKLGGQVAAVRYLPVAFGMPGIEVDAIFPISKLPALGNLADFVIVSAEDRVGDPGSIAPSITANPADCTVSLGAKAKFTAAATGTPVSTVQWQVSSDGGTIFVNIAGANSTTITFIPSITQDGDEFRAVLSNELGQISTRAARLLIHRSRG